MEQDAAAITVLRCDRVDYLNGAVFHFARQEDEVNLLLHILINP